MSASATPIHTPPNRSAGALPAPDAEWLQTDGCGGFACGTAAGAPARRYHGLLVAPRPGTAVRHVYLAHFDERVEAQGGAVQFPLSRRRHRDEPVDRWPEAARGFAPRPWPGASFQHGAVALRREILMPRAPEGPGRHAVLVRYAVPDTGVALTLTLRPRLPMREADRLTFRNPVLDPRCRLEGSTLRCRPYDSLPELALHWSCAGSVEFAADPGWDCGVEYGMDLQRGYDGHEDLFGPGVLTVGLAPGQELVLGATIDGEPFDPAAAWAAAAAARGAPGGDAPSGGDPLAELATRCARAADDFLYSQPIAGGRERRGVIAGFPWFGEWGRDTFLALPGLTLARGRIEECAAVLRGAVPFVADGLLPNIFGTSVADSHYGSVDAALWYARAVLLYDRAGGDRGLLLDELLPVLVAIADGYAAGTAARVRTLGIAADAQGMIRAGAPDLNPTWMDARPPSGAVTPRHGCPVEIAALWYSLLAQIAELAGRRGDQTLRRRFVDRLPRVGATFVERFWLPEVEGDGYLADVWRPDQLDRSVRPNMVLAASLEFSPLGPDQRRSVLQRARAELLTPVGLRTLSPRHPDYVPRYAGGPEERDRAYHQGTVWPWLLGCYVEAWLLVEPASAPELRALLAGLLPELGRCGLEHVSEVFDGDPPHRPGGTFAQAWSTAEILRAGALLGQPERGPAEGAVFGETGPGETERR